MCTGPVLYSAKNQEVYDIVPCLNFYHVILHFTLKGKFQNLGHVWVTFKLLRGSIGQVSQQV